MTGSRGRDRLSRARRFGVLLAALTTASCALASCASSPIAGKITSCSSSYTGPTAIVSVDNTGRVTAEVSVHVSFKANGSVIATGYVTEGVPPGTVEIEVANATWPTSHHPSRVTCSLVSLATGG